MEGVLLFPVVIALLSHIGGIDSATSIHIVCFGSTPDATPWVVFDCSDSHVIHVWRASIGMRTGAACQGNPLCQKVHTADTDRLRSNCNNQASCNTPVGDVGQLPCDGGLADYLLVEYECLPEVAYTLQPLGRVASSARSPVLQLTTKAHPVSAMTVYRDVCRVRFFSTNMARVHFLDLALSGSPDEDDTYCIFIGPGKVTCAERASVPSMVDVDPGRDLEVLLWFWASNYTQVQARFWIRIAAIGDNSGAELSAECGLSPQGLATPEPYAVVTEPTTQGQDQDSPLDPSKYMTIAVDDQQHVVLILGGVFGGVVVLGLIAVIVFALIYRGSTKTTTRIVDEGPDTCDEPGIQGPAEHAM